MNDDGTTITVILPREASTNFGVQPDNVSLTGIRPAAPQLVVILAAAILAGIPYGLVANHLGGSIAAIGVFYGIENTVVGWLTYEFHSIVFGFVYAGLIAVFAFDQEPNLTRFVGIGLAWAGFLWVVAAGFVAPIWLRLLGITAPIPNFSAVILVSHIAWGLTLAVLTAVGYAYISPRIRDITESLQHDTGYRLGDPDSC